MALMEVDGLTTRISTENEEMVVANGHSFQVEKGEMVGIVGESGSGKTLTARSILNLVEPPIWIESGSVRFKGQDLLEMSEAELRSMRGSEISIVFQDPLSSLNPVYTVGYQIARIIRRHNEISGTNRWSRTINKTLGLEINDEAREKAIDLMRKVKIQDPEKRYSDYPHEFSGGMRQRALIAMGLAADPELLIADEITTGLDVTTQSEIFDLLKDFRDELDMSIIFITHDLATVAETCDKVIVMYAGNIVESGPVSKVFSEPLHPYTIGLLNSVPEIGVESEKLEPIEGSPPDLSRLPTGCNFQPRCPYADEECVTEEPPLEYEEPGRRSACFKTEKVREDVADSTEKAYGEQ